jgi:hypothetical protein
MPGIEKLPSAAVVASVLATDRPINRSACTVAPSTGPFGPRTVPMIDAVPGLIPTEVVVVPPGTGRSRTVVGATEVADALDETPWAPPGGTGMSRLSTELHPAKSNPPQTTPTSNTGR